jgi:hypothetical protein
MKKKNRGNERTWKKEKHKKEKKYNFSIIGFPFNSG